MLVLFFFLPLSSMLVQCCAMINLLQVAFFLVYTFPAAAVTYVEDFCDIGTYGRPDYSDCVTLLYGNRQRQSRMKGIFNIDNVDHGFLLPYFPPSAGFTIEQWRHKVYLPNVWENGTSNRFTIASFPIVGRAGGPNHPADKCVRY